MRFPYRSSGASSVSVAAMVTPRALTTPAVKPSSASLRPGVASLAAAAGRSMSSWPSTGTATAETSASPLVSDDPGAGISAPDTTGPNSSAQVTPSAAPAANTAP